uniref:Tachykinin-2 n=1 Tax=Octopus vulgaris TaxID=6645 RepID=TKN2_OCTVU|nr:RecName: Full=Tachykinin-2; AltName: Full=OctTK-II; AltName: Full=Tachykinin II; Flags: Precursor [Octopus vulgaris]BAC53871.1 octopus tachykinin II precursor [Octopus vulgaris]
MIRVGLILCCIFIVGVFEASSADDILTAHNLIKRSEVKPPSSSEFVGLMGRSEELTRRLIQHPGSMSETSKRGPPKKGDFNPNELKPESNIC